MGRNIPAQQVLSMGLQGQPGLRKSFFQSIDFGKWEGIKNNKDDLDFYGWHWNDIERIENMYNNVWSFKYFQRNVKRYETQFNVSLEDAIFLILLT